MRIDILTLFPEMCGAAFNESILARAIEKGILQIEAHQIRKYTTNKQGKVDDYPYGGGPGLVMSYQPVRSGYDDICARFAKGRKPYTVYMSPQGTPLTQSVARRLSKEEHIVVLCGHYEGMDERVIEDFIDEEISLGDFVLTGGEIPAMALVDCVSRLVPGVLASEEASSNESHTDLLLEYPQYTRPEEIAGRKVPKELFTGNHETVEKWRHEQALSRTKRKRPDLYDAYEKRERARNTYYFDNSATTQPLNSVIQVMTKTMEQYYGNPSSLHRMGFDAEKQLRAARMVMAGAIGAGEKEIYFTSGATESNNWVFKGILPANPRKGKHILISAIEHPSVTQAALSMEAQGYTVERIPVNAQGVVDPAQVASMMRSDTALISVMHVNSETGAIQPIGEIAKACRRVKADVLIHSDCVQSFGKIPVHAGKMDVDLISVSAHKLHGPRGIGFLYIKKGTKVEALLAGGGQESGLRSGTENVPAICGFSEAVQTLLPKMTENYEKAARIRSIFTDAIREKIHTHVFTTDFTVSSPYVLNVSFPGIRAEVLLHSLESHGVYVSVGSACSSHKKDRSPVLTAMGFNNTVIDGAIRISFSPESTEEQAVYAAGILTREVRGLFAARKRK
ncbi:MAG: tRNA (guanosine(37)-N1)-methyltransferase TrmD [Clostridia bacterium]|nr:tRNA (guanosine(37)-N1)-methyltransferase TrmD [Clostridia bacterium]